MSRFVHVCPWFVEWKSISRFVTGSPLESSLPSTYRAQIEPSGATSTVGQEVVLSRAAYEATL